MQSFTANNRFIITNNSFQNLGSSLPDRVNMIGNLSVEKPTVEQMNEAISIGQPIAAGGESKDDPPFGKHIREAVQIVKDWSSR